MSWVAAQITTLTVWESVKTVWDFWRFAKFLTNHSIIPRILLKKWRIPYISAKNVGFLSSVQVKPIFPLLSHHSCWLSWHVGMFLRWPFLPGQHQFTSQDDEVDMAEVAEEGLFVDAFWPMPCSCPLEFYLYYRLIYVCCLIIRHYKYLYEYIYIQLFIFI